MAALTLEAHGLPVRAVARAVRPAARQPLVDGLQHSGVDLLAVVQGACKARLIQ